MAAILFGSIGTLADTSELQRQAFNQAFSLHNLDWQWSKEEYMTLLSKSGGLARLETYRQQLDQPVDTKAVHRSKSVIFQRLLHEKALHPRPGVVKVIQQAKQAKLKLAFVTTTSRENVLSLLEALRQDIDIRDFDLTVSASEVERPKPARDAYDFALQQLNLGVSDCVAIEDNPGGLEAAKLAGITCVAFPNQNTATCSFETAALCTQHLYFESLLRLIQQQSS
jgi:HAD superfamily hydrolase (TIGR01509 family)